MLDRRFMESKKLQNVTRDARLVYASVLPFLDREGRIIAEPIYLKAIVFRHSDFEPAEIAGTVKQLADAGLVRLYADEDNAAIIEYVDFDRFNSPNAKEAKSDLPGPDDDGSVPCSEPLITGAQAKHVQCTGIASGERNVNGTSTVNESRREARANENDETASSEARHMEYLTTGHAESQTATPARAFFRRLIGTQNANHPQARDELTRWYTDHGEAAIRDLWARAKDNPENKPRLFWFIDALNGLKGTATIRPGATALTPEEERAFWGTN